MMLRIAAVVALFPDLPEPEIGDWIARGWLRPDRSGDEWVFAEIDVARLRMLHDLRARMAVAAEDVTLVLSLLDQVYELRRTLRRVFEAVAEQPAAVQAAVLRSLGD